MSSQALLRLENLKAYFYTDTAVIRAVAKRLRITIRQDASLNNGF